MILNRLSLTATNKNAAIEEGIVDELREEGLGL